MGVEKDRDGAVEQLTALRLEAIAFRSLRGGAIAII